ncbi:hypothetical protein AC84_1565 [Escherichia coli 1-392-07_S4_C1]|nr:hypothetical protein AD40_1634 [Escherichia coli 1-392-07_S4_C3]KEO02301.1 hypothetical protein AC84_1565 [Escherichia coli 1-392-07_S4_C1]
MVYVIYNKPIYQFITSKKPYGIMSKYRFTVMMDNDVSVAINTASYLPGLKIKHPASKIIAKVTTRA